MKSHLLAKLVFSFFVVLPSHVVAQALPEALSTCKTKYGNELTQPVATDYPGGISSSAGGLTPAGVPGATTVTPRVAACLVEALGDEVVLLAAMSNEPGISGSWGMAPAGWPVNMSQRQYEALKRDFKEMTGGDMARPILVYCHHTRCFLSYNAVLRLRDAGYTNLLWLRDGYSGWRKAGFDSGHEIDEYAVNWYRETAESGGVNAQYELGKIYLNGVLEPKERALLQRHPLYSPRELIQLYGREKYRWTLKPNEAESTRWFFEATKGGNKNAPRELAKLFENGGIKGEKEDLKDMLLWILQAGEGGDADAQYLLSKIYGFGLAEPPGSPRHTDKKWIVKPSFGLSLKWRKKAAESGSPDAKEEMKPLAPEEARGLARKFDGFVLP